MSFHFTNRTYSILGPGPYAPDTGHAQTTCKALLEAFAPWEDPEELVAPFRITRVSGNKIEESVGMTPDLRQMAIAEVLCSGRRA